MSRAAQLALMLASKIAASKPRSLPLPDEWEAIRTEARAVVDAVEGVDELSDALNRCFEKDRRIQELERELATERGK